MSRFLRLCFSATLLAAFLPCSAGTVRVTLTGEWTTTETTPVNSVAPFSAVFEIDQSPVPDLSGSTWFSVDVAFTLSNGVTLTRSGPAVWTVDEDRSEYLIDFRATDITGPGDYLQAIGTLPVPAFTGGPAAPTLVLMDQSLMSLLAYYHDASEVSDVELAAQNGWYKVELLDDGGAGDPGGPAGEVPEPGTWALLGGGFLGLAAWKRRARGAAMMLALLLAVPAPAATMQISMFGDWLETGTTPVNAVTAFNATFLIDQTPTPN